MMTTSDLGLGGSGPDVEVNVGAALAHTGGALDTQHLASTVQNSTVQYSNNTSEGLTSWPSSFLTAKLGVQRVQFCSR